ncbi:amidohydrolase [Micrococcales bacterium 31B]|nr:amidohydrolase [Micrococcales bacterium 31B]
MKLDLILRNAEILTCDPARPRARTIGFWQGHIAGLDDEIEGLDAAEVTDLGGRTLVPGFIDAHCHTPWFGLGLIEPSVEACGSIVEVLSVLRAAAERVRSGETGEEWLIASGFNHTVFGGVFPPLADLDAATGDVPLFLRHNSGHLAVVNTAALRRAQLLAPDAPNPEGGTIVRDAAGAPTGVVEETAQTLFQRLFQPRPLATLERALDTATAVYASQGITSFTDAGVGGGWIGQSPAEFAAFQRCAAAGRLHARAQVMPVLDALRPLTGHANDHLGLGLDLGITGGFGSDDLSLGPVKVFLDGSLLGLTAAVTAPFCRHEHGPGSAVSENIGYLQGDPDALRLAIESAYRSGWPVAAHAIGDRAVDLALDIFEDLQARFGRNALPNRIEHASMVRPDQLPRLASANIAVTPQSSFFGYGGDAMAASLGPERTAWTYRARSFLEAGVTVAGSSDRPVADGDVRRGMQAYVDRLTGSGAVFGPESERLTHLEALSLYTVQAAAATGAAGRKGQLKAGLLADAVALSASPLDVPALTDLSIDATYRGGALTHTQLTTQEAFA